MILGDWGTTRLRLFPANEPPLYGPGIGQLSGTAKVRQVLRRMIGEAPDRKVLLCGMAGSRNGLAEVPYAPGPAGLAEWAALTRTMKVDDLHVRVAAGVRTLNFAGHDDVMRGEETQIFGAMSLDETLSNGRHLLILPGTHSKWVEVADGRIMRLQTFPTGEIFALLRTRSTLVSADDSSTGDMDGFDAGLSRTGPLLASLFEVRVTQLVRGHNSGWALGLLSGLLIGDEVRAATALRGCPANVHLIGDPALAERYERTFSSIGIDCRAIAGEAAVLAGLRALANTLEIEA